MTDLWLKRVFPNQMSLFQECFKVKKTFTAITNPEKKQLKGFSAIKKHKI